MTVMDMLAEIFEDSPEISLNSPLSPLSPAEVVELHPVAPAICRSCDRLELVDVAGVTLAGCVNTLPESSPWREEWRRIPSGLTACRRKQSSGLD